MSGRNRKRTIRSVGRSIAGLLIFGCCMGFFLSEGLVTHAKNLVVVLDAGHDDVHTGAIGNGLREELLNLQIALACKKELLTYEGVSVYMIRETVSCPYGGTAVGSSVKCNLRRVAYAQSVGADVYVSLHNNSSTNTSAKGVSVYYPTTNYNYSCGVTGKGLAQSIVSQLQTTGLENRGISVRYSEDGTRYPDGSMADYYGVIKNSKLKGIPAIIVEHAFVSNASDAYNYLSTQDKLIALGKLDAAGIAQYYGLKKKITLDYSNAGVSGSFAEGNTVYNLQAFGIKGADSVQFAVWSDAGGQDDLCWYGATQDSQGNWKVSVDLSCHATEGTYQVHTYVNNSIKIDSRQFQITGPTVRSTDVTTLNAEEGSFVMDYRGVSSGSEIDSVSAAVWNEAHPDTVKWIPAVKAGDGNYVLNVNISSFQYEYGTYQVHSYVRDKNGIVKCTDTRSVTLQCPKTNVTVTECSNTAVYYVQAEHVPYGNGMENVRVRLFALKNIAATDGEGAVSADAVTGSAVSGESAEVIQSETEYQAVLQKNASWRTSVYPAEIGTAGRYKVELYGTVSGGREVFLGEQYFEASATKQQLEGATLEPWCDYALIRKLLNRTTGIYVDYVAYEVEKEASAEVTFVLPEHMTGRAVELFRIVTGEALQPVQDQAFVAEDGRTVVIPSGNGCVYVVAVREDRMAGDADWNHRIELRDAQLVLRAALGIEYLDVNAQKVCDVDRDGRIGLSDAQLILKRALGIIKEF